MDSTKIKIHKMLRPFGVARKYVGMPMLVRAVEIAIAHPTSDNAVQKEIYSVIAAENGARWKTIESSIRRYLTVAWENNPDYMKLLAGCNLRACPTVAEFIDICSSYMLLHGAEITDEP